MHRFCGYNEIEIFDFFVMNSEHRPIFINLTNPMEPTVQQSVGS